MLCYAGVTVMNKTQSLPSRNSESRWEEEGNGESLQGGNLSDGLLVRTKEFAMLEMRKGKTNFHGPQTTDRMNLLGTH